MIAHNERVMRHNERAMRQVSFIREEPSRGLRPSGQVPLDTREVPETTPVGMSQVQMTGVYTWQHSGRALYRFWFTVRAPPPVEKKGGKTGFWG